MIEALDDLDLDRARRQVDRERARHVGVGVAAQDQSGARVLERGRVDLLAVAERRQVAAVGGHEPDPGRGRLAVRRDPDLDPDVGRGQRLDRDRAARILEAARPGPRRRPASRRPRSSRRAPSRCRRRPATHRLRPRAGRWRPARADPQPIGPASSGATRRPGVRRPRPGSPCRGRPRERRRACPRRGPAGGPTARAGRPSRRTGSARR